MTVIGYGTLGTQQKLQPVSFDREPLQAGEIEIDITFCGVCHSDIHQCADDWENTVWPCVPGHEIVGTVARIGDGVSKFAIGDTVGVGYMVNSCQLCAACIAGEQQYCSGPKSATFTYNGPKLPDGTNSYGGYSDSITVREEFVISIPAVIEPAKAAPIPVCRRDHLFADEAFRPQDGPDTWRRRHRWARPYGRPDRQGDGSDGGRVHDVGRQG